MQMLENVRGCMCLTWHAVQDCDMKGINSVANMDSDSWHFLFAHRLHLRDVLRVQHRRSFITSTNPAAAAWLLILSCSQEHGFWIIVVKMDYCFFLSDWILLSSLNWSEGEGAIRCFQMSLLNVERYEKMKCVRYFFLNCFQPFGRIKADHIIGWLDLRRILFFFFFFKINI